MQNSFLCFIVVPNNTKPHFLCNHIGCIDDREADLAVLIDVTNQTPETFNYYLLYFTWWYSEFILPETDRTNIRYILYTDEIVYSGTEPYEEFDFEFDDNVGIPEPMDDLPDKIDGADDPNFCVALDEALEFFDDDGKYDKQLIYWIPFTTHDNNAISDCLNRDDELDNIRTFALRFWSDTNIEAVEDIFGDLNWCEYFQSPLYTPSQGNSPDARYFVNTLSDFVCLDGGEITDAPTTGKFIRHNIYYHSPLQISYHFHARCFMNFCK